MYIRIKKWWATFLLALTAFPFSVSAQEVAVKTNLLYDAAMTPNIGLEVGAGRKNTLQLFYGYNPWKFSSGKQARHWVLMPEYRRWLCQRFNGHFFGIHALGGELSVAGIELPFDLLPELKDHRYEGWYVGGGITYGYQWILSRHWNFEASVGVGYSYIKYKQYECGTCGRLTEDSHTYYIGPTKVALSLTYVF